MDETEQKPTLKNKIKNYVVECQRVLRVTKKPSAEEFKVIVKISGLGIALIGLIGFLIQLIEQYLKLL
ncbi:protein translocase SEC61 complex subunit gamma [Candidatus Woesearchaeota archaeon]|nr:protein translocase SEC61 complex subunit gamma [Candidatus Woesearchaeota archaeon]